MNNKQPVESMTEILNQLDLEDLDEILEDCIFSEDYDSDNVKYAFKKVYDVYASTNENYDFMPDDKALWDHRFERVCHMFIDKIARKFNIDVNYEMIETIDASLFSMAVSMYEFFISDFESIIRSILINYILKNYEEINSIYDSFKNKKDSATLHYKESSDISPEFCLIAANIVNISEWIMDRFETNDDIMNYIDDDYYLKSTIVKMYRNGIIGGSFAPKFAELYRGSFTLKGKISLDICNMLLHKNKK